MATHSTDLDKNLATYRSKSDELMKAISTKIGKGKELNVGNLDKVTHKSNLSQWLVTSYSLHIYANKLINDILQENNKLLTKNDKLQEYSDIFSKIDEHMKDCKADIISACTMEASTDVSTVIKESLPDIVKTVVQDTAASKPFKKQWTDVLETVKEDVKVQAGQVFADSLSTALKDNQKEIVDSTKAKQDADHLERERRSRNVVISNVPESESTDTDERKEADSERAADLCGIERDMVVRCFRAGKKDSTASRSRPLIVTLKTPELARELHMYGNGKKVVGDANVWINPDLLFFIENFKIVIKV